MRVMRPDPRNPTSLRPAASRSKGFSLLELMIVIVIIGILVSVFTLSIGSFDDDETGEYVRQLDALIALGMEEATMQGREIGLRFYQHGYEFSARVPRVDENGQQLWVWVPLDADQLLRPRNFGDEYSIELLIEGKEVDLDYDREDLDEDADYLPQIFLFSSGDLAPPFYARVRQEFAADAVALNAEVDGTTEISIDEF